MTPTHTAHPHPSLGHPHVFLGARHQRNERRTWGVIALCAVMMIVEIVGGSLYGSLALVADGLHMSTHAGALLIAAIAYTYARRRANDPRFVFGTGKMGDLGGFCSAIILAMIALLIGYEAAARLVHPVAIDFDQAIPIAVVGLVVNLASAWMLGGDGHDHAGHDHGHHDHGHAHHGHDHAHHHHAHRDHNMRAAYVHVAADAAISVLAIAGLLAGRYFGWLWMDPVMGVVGALVIGNWAYGLVRDTGRILLDMAPDTGVADSIRRTVAAEGDQLADLHVWRLGPGHLGAIVSILAGTQRDAGYYRARLSTLPSLSHLTVEVLHS
ncbi:CDF family Co(II)/Ni(II) efflux transporter DmeF [Nitrospirillum iridis]|uniref:Cation diffusion facilitator family transporter n=1 Tax=Nitrospirillum iridis TaxID=765888 RepID=A0A7X0B040_9PROT|nr:CDF family Co(II)/Ni(II) efflux transporter DmeF [Nitrospirillum iridis]MBB6252220.1 cation diffusion facilitator family transporter [Nitrospirillum iridis]